MPRQRRSEVAGASYHIVSRGNNKQPIFDDVLRELFRLQLDIVRRRFDWEVYAWALMTNHFHLVLKIGDAGLSNGMRQLNTGFALASNARFGRINHCVGERFYSRQITSEHQLFASIRYTLWNPARAGIGERPADYDLDELPRHGRRRPPAESARGRAAAPLLRPRPRSRPGGLLRIRRRRCGTVPSALERRQGNPHVSVYSGPEPPSGGVRRPPLAVIAPHWTQFDGVTATSTRPSSPAGPTS